MRKLKGPTAETISTVDERDRYRCAKCEQPIRGGSRHHRKLRRFDDHSADNLLLLCGSGTTGCHGWVHANVRESYENGWLVHSWHEPREVPVRLRHGWALLVDGHREYLSISDAVLRLIDLGIIEGKY